MKQIKLFIIGMIIALGLSGCGVGEYKRRNEKEPSIPQKTESLNYSDEQIVFIKEYENWAEGYQYSVSYVTANGNEYSFSYYGDYGSESYEPKDVLSFPREEVKRTISQEEMKELIQAFQKVGKLEFTTESFACDYGEDSVYGIKYDEQGNASFVYLGSFGDNHYIPDDKNAKKICNYFGLEWKK